MMIATCDNCTHEQEFYDISALECECPNCDAELSYEEYHDQIIPEGFTLEIIPYA